jgi:hypothetical protein
MESRAVGDEKNPLGTRDSNYIAIPVRPWSFRAYTVNKFIEWELKTKSAAIPSVRYNPNNTPGYGVGIFHRSFGAWVGIRLDNSGRKEEQVQLDLQLNQYGEQFYTDLYLQYYKGFALDNTHAHFPASTENLRRADISFFSTGLNFNYLLNWKRFSMRAAFIQSELQKKSAGSFYLGISLNSFGFNADSSVVPNTDSLYRSEAVRKGTYYSTGVNAGYSYTLVWWKNFFLNGTVGIGMGALLWNQQVDGQKSQYGLRPMLRTQARFSGGYSTNRWFAGFSLILDNYNLAYRTGRMDYLLGNSRLFIGFRPNFNNGKSRR